jgi:glycosyltransferase involved in cell wall biosynthesis
MRIGIDARELCGHATGVGRYLRGLIDEWSRDRRHEHEFVLYAHAPLDLPLDARRFATRLVAGSGGTFWEQWTLPRAAAADHLDVLFSPAYTAPIAIHLPTVVAIHDVSFAAHPEWFRVREGIRRRAIARRAAAKARAVITISEFSRHEIVERLGVGDARLHVIPPGVRAPAAADRPRTEPRVLFAGSIFNRRRVPELIRAFAMLARTRPDASLDLVGENRSYPREDIRGAIAATGAATRIRWHEYASDALLTELYAAARVFAFLSEYEGLGLTPLEALAAGVPSVLLDTPVARESCGETAVYVQPADLAGTTRALEQVLFDEPLRRRLLAGAPAVLARYDWPRAAAATLAVLEEAAREG